MAPAADTRAHPIWAEGCTEHRFFGRAPCGRLVASRKIDARGARSNCAQIACGARTVSYTHLTLPTFQESERNLIERALEITRGNKLRAAQQLGISRKKLYAKLARYGMLGVTLLLLNAPVPARIGRSVREPLGVPVVAA